MLTTVVKNLNLQNMGTLSKLVRVNGKFSLTRAAVAAVASSGNIQSVRCISKSTENEMNVDYLTFREQVSPLMKDKKYNLKRAHR